jgi:methyl-accepting chemotaxis protein
VSTETEIKKLDEEVHSNEHDLKKLDHEMHKEIHRWELIVYPSLFAFVILAAYGFYLIFNLAKDVHFMAVSIDSNMTILTGDMQSMASNLGEMTANVRTMAVSMDSMDKTVRVLKPMLTSLNQMNNSMATLDQSVRSISTTTYYMGDHMGRMDYSMRNMNHNIDRFSNPVELFTPW